MSSIRIKKLESIGFAWNAIDNNWDNNFRIYQKYCAREQHSSVPFGWIEDGINLHAWMKNQRISKKNMSSYRRDKLNELGIIWNTRDAAWEENYLMLKQFHKREKHSNVSRSHTEGNCNLGEWCKTQRRNIHRISRDRKRRLDQLDFIWKPSEAN